MKGKKGAKTRSEPGSPAGNGDSIVAGRSGDFLLVGIGASAGGIQALREFFEHVPSDSGMAYVVILHLSPDHDSQLAEILQSTTKMPVKQVTEKEKVAPDHVYVVSPNMHLMMLDGYLDLSTNILIEERRAPVDIFFRTLAESHGPRAVAVVLSGTGANGSMGIKRVKEYGGATFVQNPQEAEFSEMPRNSIATELIDAILPVAEIPSRILAYKKRLGTLDPDSPDQTTPEEQQRALREIFTQLRIKTGHDFSNYKRPTLLRRIERRMNVHNSPDIPSYAATVRDGPDEARALLKDLLISVTNFFRDKEAFRALETVVIPKIFEGRGIDDNVRIWCVGCATGEEAYSLAMLCAEQAADRIDVPTIQIFATDIDETAIASAREGVYSINDAADVSADRLQKYFVKEGGHYRVRREIRETILFANHNVIKDPPFSHLDLVTCRNLLIYLNQSAKERVMERLHFALEPGRYLFLGTSESVDTAGDLFIKVDRESHIYSSRRTGGRSYPTPEPHSTFPFDRVPLASRSPEKRTLDRITYGELHQQLLEKYAPPSVIINEDHDIVHLSQDAGRYMRVPGGATSNNLLKLVLPEIRPELRSALLQASRRKSHVDVPDVKARIGDHTEILNIHVRPVQQDGDVGRGFILVVFESNESGGADAEPIFHSEEPMTVRLEEEVTRAKAQLRSSSELYEVQAEELKASNEELQAMNEELRSAAEELETSKEELQSMNEELRTLNQELKVKIEETTIAGNNLHNLINSTDVGTIFLDRELRVRLFTPSIRRLFNLIPADHGRPLSDITHRLSYPEFMRDAERVLENSLTIEREVATIDDRFLMRVVPYRTAEDQINGVVITFLDITERKQTEEALKLTETRMRLIVDSAHDYAILTTDLNRNVKSWNLGAESITGFTAAEVIGGSADIVFTPEDRSAGVPAQEAETALNTGRAENERYHNRKDGSRFYGSGVTMPLRDDSGNDMGLVKILRDLTPEKMAQEELERFNRVAVGRETRMIQLKEEINELANQLGESRRYNLNLGDEPK